MPALLFARSDRDRVLAGVCAGLAERLGVDPTLVRLVFALLALAGGAGILLYLALWVYDRGSRTWVAIALIGFAGCALLLALGLSPVAVVGAGLLVAGLATVLVRGGSLRPGRSLPLLGIVLLIAGAVILLSRGGAANGHFIAPGAVAGALVLVVGPWVWQLAGEHNRRIRAEERAEVAARIHDSVLQTLALVQRHAADPARVATLARRQERELRGWLYGAAPATGTLADALSEAAAEIEELHGVRVELVSTGDEPLDEKLEQLVLAAREAMTNAAKFSGVEEVSVYAESGHEQTTVFVRDRGAGFDRAAVAADRRGIAESIEGRMHRIGGSAVISSAPGEGTEVELTLTRAQP